MMVKQETMEQLVGMLSESLTLCREKEKELVFARNRIDGLRQDVVVRDAELRSLREARAQERAEDDVSEHRLQHVEDVLDAIGIEAGAVSGRMDKMREVMRRLCHDKSKLRDRVADLEKHAALLKETLKERDAARVPECMELVGVEEAYQLFDAVEGLVAELGEAKQLRTARDAAEADLQQAHDKLRVRQATIGELEAKLAAVGYDDLDGPDRKEVRDE